MKEAKSKTETKAWICLYTCCATRALHLDTVLGMTPDVSTDSQQDNVYLPTLFQTRGRPFNLHLTQTTEVMRNPGLKWFLAEKRVKWIFNLERAPWCGGRLERMVTSIKWHLKKTIGGAKLIYEELMTIIAEVEIILNSRLLSYVSPSKVYEPLTP